MTETDFESFGLSSFPPHDVCIDLVGQTIDGRYKLESQLGQGGFGCVFQARQKSPNRLVAVKVQKHAGRESRRMATEADLLARLDDRGIARVFEAGEWSSPSGSRIFVAMELIVGGRPLHKYCSENCLGANERLILFREVCRAVSVAHREGIIHRDLKPSNVLVDRHGQPRIIDFGISKLIAREQDPASMSPLGDQKSPIDETRDGVFMGTPVYAAPEQRSGIATPRSDVHALGVMFAKDLFADLIDGPPSWLQNIVDRCTSANPEARYADASDLVHVLDSMTRAREVRRRCTILASVTAALMLFGGSVMLILGSQAASEALAPVPPAVPLFDVTVLDEAVAVAGDPAISRIAIAVGSYVTVSATSKMDTPEHRLAVSASGVRRIAFGGAGAILAASDQEGLKVWNLASRLVDSRPIIEIRADPSKPGHDGFIALSPDCRNLFAQDGPRTLVVYDTRPDALDRIDTATRAEQAARISSLAAGATADVAFVGLMDGSVRRWVLGTGSCDVVGKSHGPGTVLLAGSNSGRRVAACGSDRRVTILDGRSALPVADSAPLPGLLTALCFCGMDDVVVASRLQDGRGTSLLRLSSADNGTLVVSGSASVALRVKDLAFTGTTVFAVVQDPDERASLVPVTVAACSPLP